MDNQKHVPTRWLLWTVLAGFTLASVACKHDFKKIDMPDGSMDNENGGGGYGGYYTTQKCGNGKVESWEECDGTDLQDKSCSKLGYSDGTLSCNPYLCTYNKSGCRGAGYGGSNSGGRGGSGGYSGRGGSSGYGGSGGYGGYSGYGGYGGKDLTKECMANASVENDSLTCKSCLCSSCPEQTLNCDSGCWEYIGCLMRVCTNSPNLVNCANSAPPACTSFSMGGPSVSMSSMNAAAAFFNSGCTACTDDCQPSEWHCPGREIVSYTDVTALNGCEVIDGDLEIVSSGVTDLSGLYSIRTINGSLTVSNTTSLYEISGLSNLRSINGSLTISSNQWLNHLNGLSQLSSVKGAITVTSNANLSDMSGLGSISSADSLDIQSNGMLYKLGFGTLLTVQKSITIAGNPNLTNLCCFDRLTEIGGDLKITDNSALSDIGALRTLQTINGSLVLERNPYLVAGAPPYNDLLAGLTSLASGLTITRNLQLDTCVIDAFVRRLVNSFGYSGTSTICGNYLNLFPPDAGTVSEQDAGPPCGYQDCI